MQFLKFSLIFLTINSALAFSGTECFLSSFDVSVSHKAFPFGLLNKTLTLSKKGCEIEVGHNEYKYHNRTWVIDICRDPIHIKSTTTSIDVYRKSGQCTKTSNDFCDEYKSIREIIEDDGLIFAEGAKNNLDEPHGQVYCASLLLNSYLRDNRVFNRDGNYDSLTLVKPVAPKTKTFNRPKAEFRAPKKSTEKVIDKEDSEDLIEVKKEEVETSIKSEGFQIDENAGPGAF